ncbi:hypothetical protein FACS1894204_11990 [Synergistales bacterium]|nr:hypothetical protein FACS1894204_11990 [Synergistales bacterium]
MPVTESVLRSGVSVKLNAGAAPSGGMKVVGVSLGKVTSDADKDKIMSVISALTPVLSLNPVRVERTTVTMIDAE